MKKLVNLILVIILLSFSQPAYCAKEGSSAPLTPCSRKSCDISLIREIQTHYFDTTDKDMLTKAVINTLQNSDFVILDIEPELGYIYARKEMPLKHTDKMQVLSSVGKLALHGTKTGLTFGTDIKSALATKQDVSMIKNEVALHNVIFDANIIITPTEDNIAVRFSLIEKVMANTDGYSSVKLYPKYVRKHNETELYNEFFSQIDDFISETSL